MQPAGGRPNCHRQALHTLGSEDKAAKDQTNSSIGLEAPTDLISSSINLKHTRADGEADNEDQDSQQVRLSRSPKTIESIATKPWTPLTHPLPQATTTQPLFWRPMNLFRQYWHMPHHRRLVH